MSNKEKSAARYEALSAISRKYAEGDSEFLEFCNGFKGATWRKLETYLKRKFEAGYKIMIVIESGAGGD